MNIYKLLGTKPHNLHYLNRYYAFILCCQKYNSDNNITRKRNKNDSGYYMESHHILPKAKDLFPEYKNFKTYPQNSIDLTLRQHYVSHLILWKTFSGSQSAALRRMLSGKANRRISSKQYEKLKLEEIAYNIQCNSGDNHWSKKEGKIHNSKINHPRGMLGKQQSKEFKKFISESQIGDKNHFYGKHHSDKSKQLMSSKSANTIWITNGVNNKKLSKTDAIPDKWVRGRTLHQLIKQKWINNGVISRRIYENESLPQGWVAGRKEMFVKLL